MRACCRQRSTRTCRPFDRPWWQAALCLGRRRRWVDLLGWGSGGDEPEETAEGFRGSSTQQPPSAPLGKFAPSLLKCGVANKSLFWEAICFGIGWQNRNRKWRSSKVLFASMFVSYFWTVPLCMRLVSWRHWGVSPGATWSWSRT